MYPSYSVQADLRIQSRAILTGLSRDASVRRRIRPNDVIAVIRIVRGVIITQFRHDISKSIMLPANKNISIAVVGINNILNTTVICLAAGCIDRKT